MPEGHTVHRLARTLEALFGGQRLAVSSPQGRFDAGAALLDGATLLGCEAWGKQLLCGFSTASTELSGPGTRRQAPRPDSPGGGRPERWLRVHLGLYGAWTFAGDPSADVVHAIGAPRKRVGERESFPSDGLSGPGTRRQVPGPDNLWTPQAPRGAVRVRLLGDRAVADLTGPTACEVLTPDEKDAVVGRLGPDPIRTDGGRGSLDVARQAFVDRVRRSRVTVGQQLMDQAVIAGVGNIYRAEVLFRARLDPLRPGRDVPGDRLAAVWDDLVVLMRDGADTGRIVTTRPEHRLPDAGGPAALEEPGRRRPRQNTDGDPDAVPADEAFYVYQRDGRACRVCGALVLRRELAGRNLFWCAVCQA